MKLYYTEAVRSIYLSPNNKLFNEGLLSMRFIDELKYVDYISLDNEAIELLCEKYNLKRM